MTIPEAKEHALAGDVPRFVDTLVEVARAEGSWSPKLDQLQSTLKLQTLPCRFTAATALAARIPHAGEQNARTFLEYVLDGLLREDGARISAEDAHTVLTIAAGSWDFVTGYALEDLAKLVLKSGRPLEEDVVAVIRRSAAGPYSYQGLREFAATLNHPLLNRGEPWADRALDDLSTMDEAWRELVAHAVTATDDQPSPKWEKQARRMLAAVGEQEARRVITGWTALLGQPRTLPLMARELDVEFRSDPHNSRAMRALVWLLGLLPGDLALARLLGDLVETNIRKIPGQGLRNPKVAGGAIYALSRLESDTAVTELSRLAGRITQKELLKELHAALDARAESRKLSREEVQLTDVPTYGLTEVGLRVAVLGEDVGTLSVVNGRVSLEWRNAAGVVLGSAPTAVKQRFPDKLKELRSTAKELAKTLAAQAERFDRQFLSRQVWPLAQWRQRYLDHVLLGTLTRRLLWTVGGVPCGFADGCLRTIDGSPPHAADKAEVALWHPAERAAEEVLAWREWLQQHGIVQPVEQAHREIYRASEGYFAGLSVRPKPSALTARGWSHPQPQVLEALPPAVRELPEWGLRAEYGLEGEHAGQLRFFVLPRKIRYAPREKPEPVALHEVPSVVYSEVVRDLTAVSR